jgi:hypothetical protein
MKKTTTESEKKIVNWDEVAEQQGVLDVEERRERVAEVLACFDRPLIEALTPYLRVAFNAGVDVAIAATLAEIPTIRLPKQRRIYEAVAEVGRQYPDQNDCMPEHLPFSDAFHACMLLENANPVSRKRPNDEEEIPS